MTVSKIESAARGERNSWILLVANAINGSGAIIAISLGGLAGSYLLADDKALATLPVAGFNLGVALGALPAAFLTHRMGRRNGLTAGAGVTIFAGLFAAAAILADSFWLFAFALVTVGISGAFVQQYRFAAAESMPPQLRSVGISRVMIGGIITALIGPQIVLHTRDLLDPTPFAGAYIAMAVLGALALLVLRQLRFPSLRLRGDGAVSDSLPPRSFGEIARQPRFRIAILCAATAFSLMSFVMTAAPLAMVDHHHTEAEAVLGIQWHVIAMFAPSLFTGRLITRFGKESIVAVGLLLLIFSALVGIAGIELLHFWGMLILLGVGWNFAFVGATAMLTDTYRETERARVEGINDLIVFGAVALASLSSGAVLNGGGWSTVNYIMLPIILLVLLAMLTFIIRGRRAAA